MRFELIYRPEAEADIEAIADYSLEVWGAAQAIRYLADLRGMIAGLADFPARHPLHRPSRHEIRKVASGSHVVFYQIADNRVEIVRIIHQRMDLDSIEFG